MSVATLNASELYTGSGGTSFPITFELLDNDHLKVTKITIATGAESVLVSGVDYNVTGGDPGTGVTTTSAVSSLYQILLERVTPRTQATNLDVGQTYRSEAVETTVDKLTYIVQEIDDDVTNLDSRLDIIEVDVEAIDAAVTAAEDAQAAAEAAQVSAAASAVSAAASAAAAVRNVIGSSSGPIVHDGTTAIDFSGTANETFIYVQGSGGATNMSANPQIDPGVVDAQMLILRGCSDSESLILEDGAGINTGGLTIELGEKGVIAFHWDEDASLWVMAYTNGIIP